MIWGIDWGNNEVKIVNQYGAFKFISTLGEWRDRNLKSKFSNDDMEYEFEGERGFAGTLAQYESELIREMKGDTKLHKDAKLRALIALHRFGNDQPLHEIVVGQPIISHNEEQKNEIKKMLTGTHVLTLNGVTKKITISRVEVAAEGAGAYWSAKMPAGVVRIIDIGSGTVNLATIADKRYIDRDSDTIKFGANTVKNKNVKSMAESIIAKTSEKWEPNDQVFVIGGLTEEIIGYVQEHYQNALPVRPSIFANNSLQIVHPVFSNAVGFYNLAKVIFNG